MKIFILLVLFISCSKKEQVQTQTEKYSLICKNIAEVTCSGLEICELRFTDNSVYGYSGIPSDKTLCKVQKDKEDFLTYQNPSQAHRVMSQLINQ